MLNLISCKTDHLLSGVSGTHGYTYYKNNTIQYSGVLAGDHVLIKNKRSLKKRVKKNGLCFFKKFLVDGFYTRTDPYYEVFLFKFTSKASIKKFFNRNDLLTANEMLFEKDTSLISSIESRGMIFNISKMDDTYTMCLVKSEEISSESFKVMKIEYEKYLSDFIYGANYLNNIPSPFSIGFETYKNKDVRNYLKPIYTLNRLNTLYDNDFNFVQSICTFSSMVENHDFYYDYIKVYDEMIFQDTLSKSSLDFEALEEIKTLCSQSNLVMFNENHFKPEHRVLVRLLLKDLYEDGFRYLALEALSEKDSTLNSRGFPLTISGFYVAEPNMGSLIREALDIGFKIIGYEANDFKLENREIEQAKNIYNKTFAQDRASKVVVLAGFDHVYENNSVKHKRMAAYFQELYNIDPITFSQTATKINETCWLGIEKNLDSSRQPVDYLICNQLGGEEGNDFINNKLAKFPYKLEVPKNVYTSSRVYLLSVYLSSEVKENQKAVPVSNILLKESYASVDLALPKGSYEYVISDINGSKVGDGKFIHD
jgi:hypothetical protein